MAKQKDIVSYLKGAKVDDGHKPKSVSGPVCKKTTAPGLKNVGKK